jgi:transposase
MGDLSDFERGEKVGARLAGASVPKSATLVGVSRATISKAMSAYTNHEKTTLAKRNDGRKSTLTERDRRTLRRDASRNHTITEAHVAEELNIHPDDLVSTKTVRRELHKFSIHGRTATDKPLITECNHQTRKRWCQTIKPGHQTTRNACVIWSMRHFSRCSLHQEQFRFGDHIWKPIIRSSWFQQMKHGEVSVMVSAAMP